MGNYAMLGNTIRMRATFSASRRVFHSRTAMHAEVRALRRSLQREVRLNQRLRGTNRTLHRSLKVAAVLPMVAIARANLDAQELRRSLVMAGYQIESQASTAKATTKALKGAQRQEQTLEQRVHNLEAGRASYEAQVRALRQQVADRDQALEAAREENARAALESQRLRAALRPVNALQKELDAARGEAVVTRRRNNVLTTKLVTTTRKRATLEAAVHSLQARLFARDRERHNEHSDRMEELADTAEHLSFLEESLAASDARCNRLEQLLSDRSAEVQSLRAQVQQLGAAERALSHAEKEVRIKESKIEHLRSGRSDMQTLLETVIDSERAADAHNDRLRAGLRKTEAELRAARARIQAAEAGRRSAEQEASVLAARNAELELRLWERSRALGTGLDLAQRDRESLAADLSFARESLKASDARCIDLEAKLQAVREGARADRSEVAKLARKVEEMRHTIERKEREILRVRRSEDSLHSLEVFGTSPIQQHRSRGWAKQGADAGAPAQGKDEHGKVIKNAVAHHDDFIYAQLYGG